MQPEIVAAGTRATVTDADLNPLYDNKPPTQHARIVWEKLMGAPFVHCSLALRLDVVLAAGCYDESMRYSGDADLITRLLGCNRLAMSPNHCYCIASIHGNSHLTITPGESKTF